MARPTALFLDLENVIGGYGEGFKSRVASLSLAELQQQIEAAIDDGLGSYAVKRAYADWSKTELKVLRKALVEEGIEPRQVFGFGDGGKTNAADVELVIDVLELAYSRPEVETFVIVSGDGGFGSLVRKLHEFGKRVIAAGYEDRASRALRSVCDVFVVLRRTTDQAPKAHGAADKRPDPRLAVSRPIELLREAVGAPPETKATRREEMLEVTQDFMTLVMGDEGCKRLLDTEGILLATLSEMLGRFIDTTAVRDHFSGLTAFLKLVLQDSGYTVTGGTAGEPSRVSRTAAASSKPSPMPVSAPARTHTATQQALVTAALENPLMLPEAMRAAVEETMRAREVDRLPLTTVVTAMLAKTTALEVIKAIYGTSTALIVVALVGSEFCVARLISKPGVNNIVCREMLSDDDEPMPDAEPPSGPELARGVLRRRLLNFPADPADITDMAAALEKAPIVNGESCNDVIARLVEAEALPPDIELASMRQILTILVRFDVIAQTPSEHGFLDSPCEQLVKSATGMLRRIRAGVGQILQEVGLDDGEIIDGLVFDPDQESDDEHFQLI